MRYAEDIVQLDDEGGDKGSWLIGSLCWSEGTFFYLIDHIELVFIFNINKEYNSDQLTSTNIVISNNRYVLKK